MDLLLYTKVYYHLTTHRSIFDDILNSDQRGNNFDILFKFLQSVKEFCVDIFNNFEINNSKSCEIIKERLFDNIFNEENKKKLSGALEKYCGILFSFQIGQCDKHSNIIDNIHNLMKDSPILMEDIFIDILPIVINKRIDMEIKKFNRGYRRETLEKLISEKHMIDIKIIPNLFPQTFQNKHHLNKTESDIMKIFFEKRFKSIFDIIMEYPVSIPTIKELSKCYAILDNKKDFSNKLNVEVEQRLLQRYIQTEDIVPAYICLIRSLRLIDPTNILEERVSRPIRSYLNKREDALESIIIKIVESYDEDHYDIYEELNQPTPVTYHCDDICFESFDVKCTLEEIYTWNPDPIEALGERTLWHKTLDLLSLLLCNYESQIFAEEYTKLLSKRLLENINFDVDKELRNLELIKRKFGPNYYKKCDVILGDIHLSKRTNKIIQEKLSTCDNKEEFEFKSYIISDSYWTEMEREDFRLPDKFEAQLDNFSKQYSKHKPSRHLKWYKTVGSVEIEVEMNNEVQNLQVTPLQAVIINYFSECSTWEISALAQKLVIRPSLVRRAIEFWIHLGFLKKMKGDYRIEKYTTYETNVEEKQMETNKEVEVSIDKHSDNENEENDDKEMFENIWKPVESILNHAGKLKQNMDLEKLFKTFMLYTSGEPIRITKNQLEEFLNNQVAKMALTVNEGNYSVKK